MKTPKLILPLLAISFLGPAAFPCAGGFPRGYVWQDTGERIFEIPRMNFHHELNKILEVPKPQPAKTGTLWSHTIEADVADLRTALTDLGWTTVRKQSISASYGSMRAAMKRHFDKSENDTRYGKRGTAPTRWIPPEERVPLPAPTPFDLNPYQDLLGELPEEFALYVQGAAAYRLEDYDGASAHWSRLLELDPEERKFRSTWAAFMLAKTAMRDRPVDAILFFEQTRTLAAEGFHDTLDLSGSSVGWQARVEMDTKNYISAVHHYADLATSQDSREQQIGRTSMTYLCRRFFKEDDIQSEIVNDPVTRGVLSSWVASRSQPAKLGARWLKILLENGVTLRTGEAGVFACTAYRAGDMETARLWIEQAFEDDLYAQWVQSKFLLRAGETDAAMAILSRLKDAFPISDNWYPYGRQYQTVPRDLVRGEIGVLKLNRQDYVSALDAFLRGRQWRDAYYVAERVLTIEELEAYVRQHGDDDELNTLTRRWRAPQRPPIIEMRYVLARRFARDGAFDRAREYYPNEPKISEAFETIVQAYVASADTSIPSKTRGMDMLAAGLLVRRSGLHIFGTAHAPDWNGSYISRPTARLKSDWAANSEMERYAAHAPVPNKPFHYVYRAADMMWEAAELLPNNDPVTARALWYGGKWLEKLANREYMIGPNGGRYSKEPDAVQLDLLPADRFYKALVNRNRNLPYAQEADRLRWFPKEPPELGSSLVPDAER